MKETKKDLIEAVKQLEEKYRKEAFIKINALRDLQKELKASHKGKD